MNAPACLLCGDRKHVKTPTGWRRCACALHGLVLPIIRHGEACYPVRYNDLDPWPLVDLTYVGSYTDWRHQVWRSVVHFVGSYEYLDAYRLVDIHFERDAKYQNIRELVGFDLVMVVLGLAELPNSFLGPVTCKLLTLRQHMGLPTWVYSPRDLGHVGITYTKDLESMLRTMTPAVPGKPVGKPSITAV